MRRLAAFLLFLFAVTRAAPAQLQPPTVRSIQVGRDTIRFFARNEEYGGSETAVFGFVRATGEWVRLGWAERMTPRHLPWESRDAIRVAPGFRLAGTQVAGRKPPGFTRFVLVSDDGQRYAIERDPSLADAWAAASRDPSFTYNFGVARPRAAVDINRWARGGNALWFSSYGADELCALFRFDLATRRFEVVVDTLFESILARAMAATPRAVWLAGTRYGSREPEGGLYEWDAARHVAARFTTANSPLPSDTVLALAAAGDTLWVSTTEGLALLDTRTGKWNVRWFRATARIDTVAVSGMGYTNEDGNREFAEDTVGVVEVSFELAPERSPNEGGHRLAYALVDELRPRSDRTFTPDSFFVLLGRVPAAHFDSAAAGRHRLAHALAHPEIVRRLVALDSANEDAYGLDADAIAAIGLLGDRAYLPTLQAFPESNYGDQDFEAGLALALARLGDTSRVAALRAQVGRGNLGFNDLRYAEALRETGDVAVLPALLAFADSTHYNSAFAAVRLFASRDQWRALVGRFVSDPRMRDDFLDWTAFYDRADTITDPVVRAALARGARLALATPAPRDSSGGTEHSAHYRAAMIAIDLRDPSLVPAFFPLLASDATDWEIATRALIMLTGVDTLPVPPRPTTAERETARVFWAKWWNERGGHPEIPTLAEGEDALRRWRLRWELGLAAR